MDMNRFLKEWILLNYTTCLFTQFENIVFGKSKKLQIYVTCTLYFTLFCKVGLRSCRLGQNVPPYGSHPTLTFPPTVPTSPYDLGGNGGRRP